jgi:hypothetical protein
MVITDTVIADSVISVYIVISVGSGASALSERFPLRPRPAAAATVREGGAGPTSVMTLSVMTLSVMTLSVIAISVTLSVMTVSVMAP